MKLKIITIGEPKLSFAKEGFNEYIKRSRSFHNIEINHLKDNVDDEKVLNLIDNIFCVVLDEGGREFSSIELAEFFDKQMTNGVGEMCFVIGGPEGHSGKIKDRADLIWSFGKMTFPHDMAMMILSEAIYRANTINAGHPYHRE